MFTRIKLSELEEGEKGAVSALTSTGLMRRRLQDLGVIEGTTIECIQKNPTGDLIAYLIRGALIALRIEDAENILIMAV